MPQINFDCPDELKERLEAYAEANYTNMSSVIRQSINFFLRANSTDIREITQNVSVDVPSEPSFETEPE